MRHFFVIAAVAVAGCGDAVPADVAAAKVEIQAAIDKWHDAYDTGNVEALEAMLDPEVSMPSPPDEYIHGKEAVFAKIKKAIEEYVISKDFQGKRKTLYRSPHITISGNLAVVRYNATVTDPSGMANALFTRVLRKSGGAWLLLTEHYTFTPVVPKPPPK